MGHRTIPGAGKRGGSCRIFLIILAAVLAVAAGGCGDAGPPEGAQPTASGPLAGSLRVLAEPEAGIGPIYQLITGARSSVDLSMYELADSTAEADLAATPPAG